MDTMTNRARLIGFLIIAAMVVGVLSVAPAIDSADYMLEAAAHAFQVNIGALFQFTMSIIYLAIAVLFYPVLEQHGKSLAIGFLSLRVIAVTLTIVGTILLASLLALSQAFTDASPQYAPGLEVLGGVIKATRDYINHGYMIMVLSLGNILMYALLIKSRLIPVWVSWSALVAIILSAFASVLVLFQFVEVISVGYLTMNIPTAVLELVLAFWLIFKGFDEGAYTQAET